jgi:hypothetical protein
MSNYQNRPGEGVIWKNKEFEAGGRKPYARGKITTPDGNEWEIALWVPTSENVKGFNYKIQKPYTPPQQVAAAPAQNPAPWDTTSTPAPIGPQDDLPF